jgi:hypothetical protein
VRDLFGLGVAHGGAAKGGDLNVVADSLALDGSDDVGGDAAGRAVDGDDDVSGCDTGDTSTSGEKTRF